MRRGRGRERGRPRVQSDFIFHNFLFFVNKVRDATRRHYARPSTALFLVSDAQLIMKQLPRGWDLSPHPGVLGLVLQVFISEVFL